MKNKIICIVLSLCVAFGFQINVQAGIKREAVIITRTSSKTIENLRKKFGVYGELDLEVESATIYVGQDFAITFNNLLPMATFKFKSNDLLVAEVDEKTGIVSGNGVGTTTIECEVTQQDTSTKLLSFEITIKEISDKKIVKDKIKGDIEITDLIKNENVVNKFKEIMDKQK